MSRAHTSALGKLKRDAAVFAVAFVGFGILLHFAIPWFDAVQLIEWTIGFGIEYPGVSGTIIGFGVILVAAAAVHDRFSP